MRIKPKEGVYQKGQKKKRIKPIIDDSKYLAWLRTLPCCVCNAIPPSEACHVRLNGRGGMAIKPKFSAVPCCHTHHTQQHQKSHLSIFPTDRWIELADYYLSKFNSL